MPLVARRAGPADSSTTIVLLHGFGSDENDLIPVAESFDPSAAVISLRGPYESGFGGFAWFAIQFLPDGSRILDEQQATASLGLLLEDLATIAERSKVILAGFSQGAMMAAAAVLSRPDLVDRAWLMSGRGIASLAALDRSAGISVPVLVQHGTYDDVVPVADGRALADTLRAAGHEVAYREYASGHEVIFDELEDARNWRG